MKSQNDIKKEWEKTKKQLSQLSKEMVHFAKKGEEEILKLSKKGKLHLDATATNLKKEKLYYLIGREYIKLKDPASPNQKLQKLVEEYKDLEQEQRALQKKIKAKVVKKKRKAANAKKASRD